MAREAWVRRRFLDVMEAQGRLIFAVPVFPADAQLTRETGHLTMMIIREYCAERGESYEDQPEDSSDEAEENWAWHGSP